MSFYIQSVEIGGPRPFYLLGPCSLECESFVWEMARSIKAIAKNLDVPLIFKASYDKANRTSVTSFRAVGVDAHIDPQETAVLWRFSGESVLISHFAP